MKSILRSLFYLGLPITALVTFKPIGKVKAQQVQEDNTVGTRVTPNVEIKGIDSDRIDGGTIRGGNLFHSFKEFNVEQGRGVYFSNPQGISNILTRVTGSNSSNISGTLGVLGNANLFLINPRGIEFGPGARLDVGGSFFASTADSLLFDNGFEFSASDSAAPPLLTVNTPIGLRFRDNPEMKGIKKDIDNESTKLQVLPGKTLGLIGGNVTFNGGEILALGARVEIGGLKESGTVGISSDGSLNFPEGVERGDVALSNKAIVGVISDGGIAIYSRNLDVSEGSSILTGIGGGLGTANSQAGDININATDIVTIDGTSSTDDLTAIGSGNLGNGNAGKITVNAGSVNVKGNAQISSVTAGQGDAGSIIINAQNNVLFSGSGSGILSVVAPTAVGNGSDININVTGGSFSLSDGALFSTSTLGKGSAGNIQINAGNLSLTNGSSLSASTLGEGNAGNVTIKASDSISFYDSKAFSNVGKGGIGNAGGIEITTGNLSLANGAQLTAGTSGKGNAGRVRIQARDSISFDGVGSDGLSSGAFSNVEEGGIGNAGGIEITTGNLSLTNGAQISAGTFGKGNAGRVRIKARDSIFDGVGSSGFSSGAFSNVEEGGIGNAVGVDITTTNLFLTNGAQLSTSTFGKGNAGRVRIQTRDSISFDGVGSNGSPSGAFSTVNEGKIGNAGGIEITTGNLFLTNGAALSASTLGEGNAGNVTIKASDSISFDNSKIFSRVGFRAIGNAGGIDITTSNLSLTNGAQLTAGVDFLGRGDAGNIIIKAIDSISFDGVNSGAFSRVNLGAIGNAGGIEITTSNLSLTNGAQLTASVNFFGKGDAGNIIVKASDSISFDGVDSGAFSRARIGAIGNAGGIDITTGDFRITNSGTITATSTGKGEAGSIKLKADNLTLADRGTITAQSSGSSGGNINLNIKDVLLLRRKSEISATAGMFQRVIDSSSFLSDLLKGNGDGGNIDINTGLLVALPKENSDITANAFSGTGGRVNIEADSILGIEPLSREELEIRDPDALDPRNLPSSDITAISQGDPNLSGQVTITTPNIDPGDDLVELPENITDPREQIAQNPCKQGVGSEFTQVGRGGLPIAPNQTFSSSTVRVGLVNPVDTTASAKKINTYQASNPTERKIVPAQGWVFNEKGEVVLTSYDPQDINVQRVKQTSAICSGH